MSERRIGVYKILEKIGEGGMGVVYRALDEVLQRPVALKVIRAEALSAEAKERFLREARSCSRINHPSIVTVYAAGEEEGHPYMAMEFLQGRTLREVVDEGPVPWPRALQWAADILAALGRVHEAGIVHRDVKPENIMVTDGEQVKLMDFGIARTTDGATLTKEGLALGTLYYMSPEQMRGGELDQRSDIFAVGAVLYHMLTGQLPFQGEHPVAVMYSVENEDPEPLENYGGKWPPGLQECLDRALAKDPRDRFTDAASFAQELRDILGGEHSTVAPPGPMGKRLLKSVLVVVVSALLILLALYWNKGRQAGSARSLAVHHNELGQAYEKDGSYDKARMEYRRAILADPDYVVPWNNLAVLAMGEGNMQEADSLLRDAIARKPGYAAALFNLASVRWDMGRKDDAEDLYLRSIEADSSFWPAYTNLAELLVELGRAEEALSVLDRGLALSTANPFLLKKKGEAAWAVGQKREARQYWTSALQSVSGKELVRAGKRFAVSAREIELLRARVNGLLAVWYEDSGELDEAVSHWQDALDEGDEELRRQAREALKKLARTRTDRR